MKVTIIGVGRIGLVVACSLAQFDIRETGELTQLYWRSLDSYLAKHKTSRMLNQLKAVIRFFTVGAAKLAQIPKARPRN